MTILLQSTPIGTSVAHTHSQTATNGKPHSSSSTAGNSPEKQLRDKTAIDITSGDLWILVGIALVAGCLGGWYNYRRTNPPKPQGDTTPPQGNTTSPNTDWGYLVTCLLGGVIACALIPLFLQTIQSQLLYRPTIGDFTVFAGLCLIAAISSNSFIDTLTKRVLDQINVKADAALQKATDANATAKQASTTATDAHQTALTNREIIKPIVKTLADAPLQELNHSVNNGQIDQDQLSTLIKKPNMVFRSVDSVVKESGQQQSIVQAAFDQLQAQEEVEPIDVDNNTKVYLIKR